jgi:hypothetical protein
MVGHPVTYDLLIGEPLLSPLINLRSNIPNFCNFRVNQFQYLPKYNFKLLA